MRGWIAHETVGGQRSARMPALICEKTGTEKRCRIAETDSGDSGNHHADIGPSGTTAAFDAADQTEDKDQREEAAFENIEYFIRHFADTPP